MGRPLAAPNTGDPQVGVSGPAITVLEPDEGPVALRHHQIRRLVESEAVQLSLFDERHLAEVRDYPGERVCHNPLLAEHRRQKREALLRATALARIARQVARRTRTPLSATEIAERAASRTASRWPNTDPSTMSGAPKPSSGRRNWTGSTCCGPANRPIACQQPPWCGYKDLTRVSEPSVL